MVQALQLENIFQPGQDDKHLFRARVLNTSAGSDNRRMKMAERSKGIIVIELLFASLFVLLGNAAFAEPVQVEGGLLQGTVEHGLRVYRGIPYAAPPVGDLRWRAPAPAP